MQLCCTALPLSRARRPLRTPRKERWSLKLTRHNGRAGKHGTYNPKHNDRSFEIANSEHIDLERVQQNIYWDCYNGIRSALQPKDVDSLADTFEEVEKLYYKLHYTNFTERQNERNAKIRHTERNRSPEDLLTSKKTCPEESIYQLGTLESHASPKELFQIATEFMDEFHERFGKHVHILDWALHLDEGTPHIHERHVFDCENKYGEIAPQQEKALEALGFELPKPDKPLGRYNNRKITFDAACRTMLFEIAKRHGLELDEVPEYGGRAYLEKRDYIMSKQKEQLAQQEKAVQEQTAQLENLKQENEAPLKKEIYEQVRYYATTSVARRIEHIMQAIKLACASEPPEIQTDRIHVRNGTYFVDGHFTPEKEYCMNRLPISYVPEAPAPTRWLQFLNELLYEEDIPALQEYIGYCLLPVTKAQKMLLMVGKGGEGKSRIGLILRELFGSSMYTGSLQKVETNRFARADLEYKLLLVDDDMKTEALPQTNNIKTLVTLEDKIDIERKGQQSVQGTLYVRFACFGNGSLHALYDKSNGFYRRQLLLTTKEKPVGRVDDPFLIDKMRNEKEGILLWALEGLHRLIRNNYQFTISERTAANLKEAMEQGNNILGFLKSEGYFEIRQGAKCKSTDFYKVYERWCMDNLEKPLAASTFIHHLKDNQKSLGIVYDDKCIGTNRGFHNVDVDLFLPVDVPSPWDKKIELT